MSQKLLFDQAPLTNERLNLLKGILCQLFLTKSKDWVVKNHEANLVMEVIKPFQQLLEAKKKGSHPGSLQDSQSQEGSFQLATITKIYEDLKAKVIERESHLKSDMNISEGIVYFTQM